MKIIIYNINGIRAATKLNLLDRLKQEETKNYKLYKKSKNLKENL